MLLAVSHALIRCRTWGAIYICTYDGELKLQAEEVQAVLLMSVQEIFARQHEFTGACMYVLCCLGSRAWDVIACAGDSVAALRLLLDALPDE